MAAIANLSVVPLAFRVPRKRAFLQRFLAPASAETSVGQQIMSEVIGCDTGTRNLEGILTLSDTRYSLPEGGVSTERFYVVRRSFLAGVMR